MANYESTKIIILGSGMETNENGLTTLNAEGLARADRFLEHYADNQDGFNSDIEAFVVCSGGYSLIAKGMARPVDPNKREGIVTGEYLLENGIPSSLIKVEKESVSSSGNLLNSIAAGYFTIEEFSPQDKLGIVSHPHHLKRVALLTRKMGFAKGSVELIPTSVQDSRLMEFAARTVTRGIYLGAKGPEAMLRQEQRLKNLRGNK